MTHATINFRVVSKLSHTLLIDSYVFSQSLIDGVIDDSAIFQNVVSSIPVMAPAPQKNQNTQKRRDHIRRIFIKVFIYFFIIK